MDRGNGSHQMIIIQPGYISKDKENERNSVAGNFPFRFKAGIFKPLIQLIGHSSEHY